jgi:hypothetical protein
MDLGSKRVKDFKAQKNSKQLLHKRTTHCKHYNPHKRVYKMTKRQQNTPTKYPKTYSQGTKDRNTTNRTSSEQSDTKKLTRASSRRHHMQRKKKPTTHRV